MNLASHRILVKFKISILISRCLMTWIFIYKHLLTKNITLYLKSISLLLRNAIHTKNRCLIISDFIRWTLLAVREVIISDLIPFYFLNASFWWLVPFLHHFVGQETLQNQKHKGYQNDEIRVDLPLASNIFRIFELKIQIFELLFLWSIYVAERFLLLFFGKWSFCSAALDLGFVLRW